MYRPATRMATQPLEKLENPHLSHQFSRPAAKCPCRCFRVSATIDIRVYPRASRAWSELLGRWGGGGLGSLLRRWSERMRQRPPRTDGSLQRTCNGWSGLVLWKGTRSERLTSTGFTAAGGARVAARRESGRGARNGSVGGAGAPPTDCYPAGGGFEPCAYGSLLPHMPGPRR
jgi:hypothetical protein